jgi:signal transduction histidine kinase
METKADWYWFFGPVRRHLAGIQRRGPALEKAPRPAGETKSETKSKGAAMSNLTLASVNPTAPYVPTTQWAHDIRNALAIMSLHLETLERLSGAGGRKAASAAQAVMKRTAGMCSATLEHAQRTEHGGRRRGFDLGKIVKEIAQILEPAAPDGFEIRIAAEGAFTVMGDSSDVFRIIFNLVQNAVAAARGGCGMTHVTIALAHAGRLVSVRISDDGPGLPKAVRAKLFRPLVDCQAGCGGLGIAIARELAERNGATLQLDRTGKGTAFVLGFPGVRTVALDAGAAMPSLG